MASVVLFHSVLGLRQVEREAADRLRAAGHTVCLPDLFGGARTDNLDEGFAIKARIGWDTIRSRAMEAAQALPEDAVLAGVSMGAGVVAEIWPCRPKTAAVLLLHGLADVPQTARQGTPVQVHVSAADEFFPLSEVRDWQSVAQNAGLSVEVFTYKRAGHYFIDRTLLDYDGAACAALWSRILKFLDR